MRRVLAFSITNALSLLKTLSMKTIACKHVGHVGKRKPKFSYTYALCRLSRVGDFLLRLCACSLCLGQHSLHGINHVITAAILLHLIQLSLSADQLLLGCCSF